MRGSLPFMAPERLLQQPFDASVDVYSFAMTLWQIICRVTPFYDLEQLYEKMNDLNAFMIMFRRRICVEHYRPPLNHVPSLVKKFLINMFFALMIY